jgi:hypothetical protein
LNHGDAERLCGTDHAQQAAAATATFWQARFLATRQSERLYAHNLTFAPSQLIAAFTYQPLQALQSG